MAAFGYLPCRGGLSRADVEGLERVVEAVQIRELRVLAHIQAGERVVLAVQRREFCVFGHVEILDVIGKGIKCLQIREIFDPLKGFVLYFFHEGDVEDGRRLNPGNFMVAVKIEVLVAVLFEILIVHLGADVEIVFLAGDGAGREKDCEGEVKKVFHKTIVTKSLQIYSFCLGLQNFILIFVPITAFFENMKKFLFLALGLALILGCEKNDKHNKSIVFDFTKENLKNGDEVKSFEIDGVSLTFSFPVTYSTDDQALRIPYSTTFCLSSDKTIEKILFSFGKEDKEAPITAFEGEFSVNAWTGAAKKVFLKIDGTSGSRSISRMTVTLGKKESCNMTDVIDASFTGVTSATLSSWSEKKGTASPATYRGKTATEEYREKDAIVLTKEKGGIVSNGSGGYVRHIEVKWSYTKAIPVNLLVYGDNLSYGEPSELYNSSYAGTLLGTFSCGSNYSTIIDVKGNYKYVGLRQEPDNDMNDSWNKLFIDKIEVTWE